MPFDIAGNFTRSYNFVADRNAAIKIQAARVDGEYDNFATGLNLLHLRDGRAPATGDWKMGTNKITGLGGPTIAGDAISLGSAAGTPLSITLTNATGLPLTSAVVGILPVANGGSGSATGGFVTGMLMLWYGTIAGCPAGWHICDGTGGTPDMRGRFAIGATGDGTGAYPKNATGGLAVSNITVAGHTLIASELPVNAYGDSGHGHVDYGHVHADAGHLHTVSNISGGNGRSAGGIATAALSAGIINTDTAYANIQSGNANISVDAANISNPGGGNAHAHAGSQDTNLPPYMALHWIMRL